MAKTDESSKAKTDGRKWIWLVLAILGTAIGADGIMISMALSNGGPKALPDAYARALRWDETQSALEASAKLGWLAEVRPTLKAPGRFEFDIQVKDQAGALVEADQCQAWLTRPSDATFVQELEVESLSPGHFVASTQVNAQGLWLMRTELKREQDRYLDQIRLDLKW